MNRQLYWVHAIAFVSYWTALRLLLWLTEMYLRVRQYAIRDR